MAKSSQTVSFADDISKVTKPKPHTTTSTVLNAEIRMWKMVKPEDKEILKSSSVPHGDIQMNKCVNLSSGKMIFTEPKKKILQIYDDNGNCLETIHVSGRPFDITIISSKLIAISYGEGQYVEIFDLKSQNVVKTYQWDTNCFGVANRGNELYVAIEGRGIVVLDFASGHTIKTLPLKINQKSFLIVTDKGIVYTNWIFNTVHCYDFNGKEKWIFKKNILNRPIGITADADGNIFVAGNISGNILYISADGIRYKELAREPHMMDLNFDCKTNRLLALKSNGSAFKYFAQF